MRVLRRPLGGGPSPARLLRALREEEGLVALAGAWAGGERFAAAVAYGPSRVVEDPNGLVAALDDLPAVAGAPCPDGAVVGAGWLGVLGYQLGRHFERLAPPAVEPPGPLGRLGYYESVLVQDDDGRWWFEALVGDGEADPLRARFDAAKAALARAVGPAGEPGRFEVGAYALEPGRDEHARAVEAVKAYIEAGDVFQVNACLHARACFAGDPLELFCTGLERLRPRYGAFVATPGGAVCSFSPELFLRVEGRTVLTSPIKGTARREEDPARAEEARVALVASAKDGAENAMIVDLMRNDLGRVCTPGTVRVAALARAEAHPGVWHLVSDVVGELAPGRGHGDLLAATFPAGSITGAPKVRAMEIVNELEPVGRGAYTGSVVLASPLAGLTANVAIRTFEVDGAQVRLGVGGGIVADSDVEAEVEECFTKARPLLEATGGRLVATAPAPGAAALVLRPRPAWGVFETLRVEGGKVPLLDRHLARLTASVEEVLGRRLPDGVVDAVVGRAAALEGAHRLRVTVRPAGASVRVDCTTEAVVGAPDGSVGLEPVVVEAGLGAHKWLDRRLLGELRPPGLAPADQVLLVDVDGAVLEAERASVFAVVDGVLRTPAATGGILPGVARAVVLEEACRRKLPLGVGRLGLDELDRASEVFVTNALRGVETAARVGARRLPSATPMAAALAAALRDVFAGDPPRACARSAASTRRGPVRASGWARRGGPVVVVDNADSFTYNLTQALAGLGADSVVVRSTEVTVSDVAALDPSAIVLSPGPCTPGEAGICVDVVRRLSAAVPTLGVCLGHQCIAAAYGASVVRAPLPVHGKTSPVIHDGSALFAKIPPSFEAARYHSLVVDEATLPGRLAVSARTGTVVMALRHLDHPVFGVQFHPESFLTGSGEQLLANFLALARR